MNLKEKGVKPQHPYSELIFYKEKDVKGAILEFENQLIRAINDGCKIDKLKNVLDEHIRIFGDFDETTHNKDDFIDNDDEMFEHDNNTKIGSYNKDTNQEEGK